MRLVVRTAHPGANPKDVADGAKQVIRWCVKAINVDYGNSEEELRRFTESRFGWQY